ncbi:MAG: DMT family transporter [Sphingomonadales bacterium]|nr:MAG: DMT family transporter [Sphingomonadales bacterium]
MAGLSAEDGAARRRVMAWAALFAVTWALLEIAVSLLLHGRYDVIQIVWCRYAAHIAAVMLIWGLRRPRLWRTRSPVFQVARSLMMLVMPVAFAIAIREGVSLDFVESIFWTAPFQIVLLARLFTGDVAPLTAWAAAIIGSIGSAAIFGHLLSGSLLGVSLALAGSLSFSAYIVMTRSLRDEPAPTNLLYTGLAVFVVLTPFMPMVWIWPTASDWAVLVMIGVVGVGALYALERACEAGAAWLVAIMLFAQVICLGLLHVGIGGAPRLQAEIGIVILVGVLGAFWMSARWLAPSRRNPAAP